MSSAAMLCCIVTVQYMALIPCTVHTSNEDVRFNSIPGTGVEDKHVSSDQVHTLAVCDINDIASYQATET